MEPKRLKRFTYGHQFEPAKFSLVEILQICKECEPSRESLEVNIARRYFSQHSKQTSSKLTSENISKLAMNCFLSIRAYESAYEAVQRIKQNTTVSDTQILRSALNFTFRLPPLIRQLISRIYQLDDIKLEGRDIKDFPEIANNIGVKKGCWENLWQSSNGLYLVIHSEQQSKRSNEVEVSIIEQIIAAAGGQLPNKSVAIVTPHRAQRTLLKTRLADYYGNAIDVIDTVERLQGGERPTVIVSATASDPVAIGKNVEFILDLNRSNVAFSRAQNRLIVVCSETLLCHIPAEVEHYESAMLWKYLRAICSHCIASITINKHEVRVLTPPPNLLQA